MTSSTTESEQGLVMMPLAIHCLGQPKM